MYLHIPALLPLLVVATGLPAAPAAAPDIDQRKTQLTHRLQPYFDRQVENIDAYVQTVETECAAFPEGTLFPYVLPALAYGNLALDGKIDPKLATQSMATLVRPALVAFQRSLGESNGTLLDLTNYQKRATEIGQINLALSVYAHIGGSDSELLALNAHFTRLLARALERNQGAPLMSYPYLSWPFDTIPCLVSIILHDPSEPAYRRLADGHLKWLRSSGENEATGLPFGESNHRLPRGCDLSLRLPLIRHFAPELASHYYQIYLKSHWSESALGFREWPRGQDRGIDIDSGPIFQGIGLSATGNGIAAVLAFDDTERANILFSLLEQRDLWVGLYQSSPAIRTRIKHEFEANFAPIDTQYFTGFLYGDAALFYMLTWTDYGLVTDPPQ